MVVPRPGSLSAAIVPLCACTRLLNEGVVPVRRGDYGA